MGFLLGLVVGVTFPVSATIPNRYTNDNFFMSDQDAPVSFTQDAFGNFSGMTVSGKLFYQTNISNTRDIRLQRFSIDDTFFYISDRGIILADSDTIALSIYLTRVS